MPIDWPDYNLFHRHSNENTMVTSLHRTALSSLYNLKYRYRQQDVYEAIRGLCTYLAGQGSCNHYDSYRIAERALDPYHGTVGSSFELLEAVGYYWLATIDESPDIISDVATRKAALIRGMREIQRGNNANQELINTYDDYKFEDFPICIRGSINKFAEVFVGLHPDVYLVAEINNRIYELFQGFLIQQYQLQFSERVDDQQEVTRFQNFLNYIDVDAIKAQVICSLGGLFNERTNPFSPISRNEINFLDSVANNLEYIPYPGWDLAQKLLEDVNQVARDSVNRSHIDYSTREFFYYYRAQEILRLHFNLPGPQLITPTFSINIGNIYQDTRNQQQDGMIAQRQAFLGEDNRDTLLRSLPI